jgi:DNA segregation ATPase FtsK/SpoIIIE, S-DNA-T family
MTMDVTTDQPQRFLPRTLEDLLASWFRRACGLGVMAVAGIAWLALLTWSINDPSLAHATSETPRNVLGLPGAYLADALLQMVGVTAIFLLVPIVIAGLQLLVDEKIAHFRSRIVLAVLAVPSLAAGLSALPATARWPLPYGYGGAFGDIIFDLTSALMATFISKGSGAATGIAFFIFGFWAFSRTIGLDRRQIFSLIWFAGKVSGRGVRVCVPSRASVLAPIGWLLAPRETATSSYAEFDHTEQRDEGLHQRIEPTLPGRMTHVIDAAEAPSRSPISMPSAPFEPIAVEPEHDRDPSARLIAERFAPANITPRAPTDDPAPSPIVSEPTLSAPPPTQTPQPAMQDWQRDPRTPNGHAHYSGLGAPVPQPRDDVYRRPGVNLLEPVTTTRPTNAQNQAALAETARLLEEVLADFRVKGEVTGIRPGPVVTLYEFEPARGIKSSRIVALADDIARSMSARSARIATVPGRSVIGIELPNAKREKVALRDMMEAPAYRNSEAKLPLALGKTIAGEPVVADLARMPHLLVAGTTGSGKSVGINAMILSLLYRLTPEDCRMIMIDPKMLELSVYNDIPHLLTPVVTEPQRALAALNWAVGEMEERYKRMAELGVRNLEMFNNRVRHAARRGEALGRSVHTGFDAATGEPLYEQRQLDLEPIPYIVVIVDEFADLMTVAGKEIEVAIQRLAQKARAAGIHLIMATQRPSVDIVTGTIKANFPTRISFKVASRIDSRTILNEQGAEQLLGQGDMLFADGGGQTQRLHGPYVSDEEVQAVARSLQAQGRPDYIDGLTEAEPDESNSTGDTPGADNDAHYDRAVAMVLEDQRASTSYIQRRLSIGYTRAARLLDRMQENGIVSAADSAGRRRVVGGLDAGNDGAPRLI